MGKYRSNSRHQTGPARNQIPPLVRGIGCLTMVLIPLLSYGLAVFWIQQGWPGTSIIPPSLLGAPSVPGFLLQSKYLAEIGRAHV